MGYFTEFSKEYSCQAPDYLPESLRERISFLSCLSEKNTRIVYLVEDRESSARAILKITLPGSPDNTSREYALLTKLDHAAIPDVILYDKDDEGREYLLRSYAEGETLDRLIARDGVFDKRQALEIILKLCDILSYLHKQSPPIIYRDIKPQNIVITPNGKITLIDFGISREDISEKSFDTVYVGSVGFAAPEQFGFTKTDSRSDVYALGKLLLYLVSGQTELSELESLVSDKSLARIISKCTALSPEKRYLSMGRVNKAVSKILYPATCKEILTGAIVALLVFACALFILLRINKPDAADPQSTQNLIAADGGGVETMMEIPVLLEILMDGEPFSDCSVSVDNHHWYAPAANGKAELLVYPGDEYAVQAAYENRTASKPAVIARQADGAGTGDRQGAGGRQGDENRQADGVRQGDEVGNRDGNRQGNGAPYSFTLDLALVPSAPSCLSITKPFGQRSEIKLDINGADTVTITGQPDGIQTELRNDSVWFTIDETVQTAGYFTVMLEAVNEFGRAETVISLALEEENSIIAIRNSEDLNAVRNNLSGHYIMETDIDLSDFSNFIPIGNGYYPFTGVFDGNGYTISGFYYTDTNTKTDTEVNVSFAGLFGFIDHGVVRNLIIKDADILVSNSLDTGFAILAGKSSGLIERCAVLNGRIRADIAMESSAGSICGVNTGAIDRKSVV